MMPPVTQTIQSRDVQLFWKRTTTIIVDWFIGHTYKVSGIPNPLNYYVIFYTTHTLTHNLQMWL